MAKFTRLSLKLLPLILLLLLIGAAFSFPKALLFAKQPKVVINTGGFVEMSKCTPCHQDINAFENPNLINFSHSVHFKQGIACRSCHVVFPHRPSGTVKPSMEICSNCHRLSHGKQGQIAPEGKCKLCHPADFKLTPDDHDRSDFLGSIHGDKAREDRQQCLICHIGDTCEVCHAKEGVPPAKDKDYRWFGFWSSAGNQGAKITVGGSPVTMGACRACHSDLQKWKNDKLINFNHPIHFKQQIDCEECHKRWPHSPGRTDKPAMSACSKCHRLDHGNQGRLVKAEKGAYGAEYCPLCHPADMKLKPDYHTFEFIEGDHKRLAKVNKGLCRGCHAQTFCDNCHRIKIPHAPGWQGDHGRVAAIATAEGKDAGCFKCHLKEDPKVAYKKAPSCARCHKAVVYPHPAEWATQHGQTTKNIGRESCDTCHIAKAFCDKCHGEVKMPHGAKWLGQHRLFLRDHDLDACLTCHSTAQCEQCHATHKIHNRHSIYKSGI